MDKVDYITAKNIVFKTTAPDKWFGIDYNMNIYRGCSHGCIYCDSRSDCFQNTDFDTVKPKENALEIIRDDLRRKVKKGVVGTGAMSDPYNPLEEKLNLTRNSLELINAFGFGVSLTTKSGLIARDADILRDINSHSPVIVKFSVSSADDELCKKLEPNVFGARERFSAMRELSERGIFCGVMMIPILPFVTDNEDNIVQILRMARESGARFVYTHMSMTLRKGSRGYYYQQLDELFPNVSEKYRKKYGNRYNCVPTNSKKLWGVFTSECERLGLLYDMKAIIHNYKAGYGSKQISLFS